MDRDDRRKGNWDMVPYRQTFFRKLVKRRTWCSSIAHPDTWQICPAKHQSPEMRPQAASRVPESLDGLSRRSIGRYSVLKIDKHFHEIMTSSNQRLWRSLLYVAEKKVRMPKHTSRALVLLPRGDLVTSCKISEREFPHNRVGIGLHSSVHKMVVSYRLTFCRFRSFASSTNSFNFPILANSLSMATQRGT